MTEQNTDNFDDTLLDEALAYPDWFKFGLGDLNDDTSDAGAAGKFGIIVYYGQKRCAYCENLLLCLADSSIEHYLREHFDVIPVDIWGIEEFVE